MWDRIKVKESDFRSSFMESWESDEVLCIFLKFLTIF